MGGLQIWLTFITTKHGTLKMPILQGWLSYFKSGITVAVLKDSNVQPAELHASTTVKMRCVVTS